MQETVFLKEAVESDRSTDVVERVRLTAFRNYRETNVDLAPGFNILTGRNAQGKTNLLEALYLVSTTRLLRGKRDAEAILDGEEAAQVELELAPSRSELKVVLQAGVRKKALLNKLSLPRAADLIGRLPAVFVGAEDMILAKGEPSERRLFLDLELSGLYPAYLRHLTVYKRALEQRNSLIRQAEDYSFDPSSFEPWEIQMAEHGQALREQRHDYMARLQPLAASFHATMGGGEALRLDYVPRDPATSKEELMDALIGARHADLRRGATTVGPHKDDLNIFVGDRDVRLFGSQGQQRTSVIALKMGCLKAAEEVLKRPPLLLLDDILSDLDETRRRSLSELVLEHGGQAVLTCTEETAAGEEILSRARIFRVKAGSVSTA